MLTKPNELLGYALIFWRAAGGGENENTTRLLRVLCERWKTFEAKPPSTAHVTHGFLERECVIWCRRDQLVAWGKSIYLKDKGASDTFNRTRPFQKKTHRFAHSRKYDRWSQERLDLTPIHQSERATLKTLAVDPATLGFHGALVVGAAESTVWLGTTYDLELVDKTTPDSIEELQQLVARYETPADRLWARLLDRTHPFADQLSRTNFPQTARAIIHASLPVHTQTADETTVDIVTEDTREKIAVLYSDYIYRPSQLSHRLRTAVNEVETALSATKQHVNAALVCTNTSYEDARTPLLRILRKHTGRVRRAYVVDPSALRDLVAAAPWTWSQYLGDAAATGFSITRGRDVERVRELLVTSQLSRLVPIDAALTHPNLPRVIDADGDIDLIGRPGAGKSVAAYQLLARHFRDAIVGIIDPEEWNTDSKQLLTQVLLDADTFPKAVLVLDDAHFYPERVADLEGIKKRLKRVNRHATIVLLYWSSEATEVRRHQGHGQSVTTVDLDVTPDEYLLQIATLALETLRPELSATDRAAHARGYLKTVTRWDRTPHTLTSYIVHETQGADGLDALSGNLPYWTEKFRKLRDDSQRAALLLRIFAAVRVLYNFEPVPKLLLEDAFHHFVTGRPTTTAQAAFEDALTSLIEQRWLSMSDGLIASDHTRTGAYLLEQASDGRLSTILEDVFRWLLNLGSTEGGKIDERLVGTLSFNAGLNDWSGDLIPFAQALAESKRPRESAVGWTLLRDFCLDTEDFSDFFISFRHAIKNGLKHAEIYAAQTWHSTEEWDEQLDEQFRGLMTIMLRYPPDIMLGLIILYWYLGIGQAKEHEQPGTIEHHVRSAETILDYVVEHATERRNEQEQRFINDFRKHLSNMTALSSIAEEISNVIKANRKGKSQKKE